jgi:hypothetical protein
MDTIIKIFFSLRRLQPSHLITAALGFPTSFSWWNKLITKTLDKLSIPQLFRKQSKKNPFLTKKK